MTDHRNVYTSREEIEAVVHGFENCTTPDSEFDHRAHLTVALSYLHLYGLTIPEATERMRAGLYRFLDYHGHDRQKYHETITLFWIKFVQSFLKRTDASSAVADLANEMNDLYGNSQFIYNYYSKERLSSDEARKGWVEPDVKPLDF